ncbi:MAG TPA: PilZ domain-containing protein [Rhizomicrobium sp.]|jgi:hypothetical protein|nr:PilZ domain-containing protein [Rhizomicrobium sp.]
MSEPKPLDQPSGAEKRRFRRVTVDLPGRLFFPADSREERCTVADLSPGGAAVRGDITAEKGAAVVLYADGFGRFEGHVARLDGYGFGIAFVSTPAKRERTAEQLTLFLNKALADDSVLRRHERSGRKGFAKFTRADGQIVSCEVMDISVGGVSLRTEIKPPVGEFVLIAQIAGRVARHHEHGIGIEFIGQDKHASEAVAHLNLAR